MNTFYEDNPNKNLERYFTYEKVEYKTTNSEILKVCGEDAYKLVTCKKVRYGYEVVYQLKPGTYDPRDSNQVSGYVSFLSLPAIK